MRRAVLLVLVCALFTMSLSGCNDSQGQYWVIETLSTEVYALGFRAGDKVREPVEVALAAMQADGTAAALSFRWFGRNVSLIDGDTDPAIPPDTAPRVFIAGVDEGAPPMSYRDDYGIMRGFSVELAEEICRRLGWELIVLPINPANVDVELSSGNIDCAFGSMGFVAADARTEIGMSYMENKKVLVSRSDSRYKKTGDLRGLDIGMTYDPASLKALQSDAALYGSIRSYIQYSTSEQCFLALIDGDCAAILVDSLTVEYYERNQVAR